MLARLNAGSGLTNREGQPAFERVAGLSERRCDGTDRFDRFTWADHHAERQVAVAADHLGHGVHDEGRPQLDRPAEQRRERVVDDQGNAGPCATGRRPPGRQPAAAGWRWSPRKSAGCAGCDQRLAPVERPDRRCRGLRPTGELSGDERRGLAVESLGDEHVIALVDERQQGRCDGPHAGGTHQARFGALDRAILVASCTALGWPSRA